MENVISVAMASEGPDTEWVVTFGKEFSLKGSVVPIRDNIYRIETSSSEYYFDVAQVIHIHKRR